MLRRIENFFVKIAILADSITLVISFVFAYYLRTLLHSLGDELAPPSYYGWALALILPIFICWLAAFGLYRSGSLERPVRLIGSIAKACALSILTLLTALFMIKDDGLSRLVVNIFALAAVVGLTAERLGLRLLINQRAMLLAHDRRRRRPDRPRWEVLLVAEPQDAHAYLSLVDEHPHWGIEIAAIVHPAQGVRHTSALVADGGGESSVTYGVGWQEILDQHVVDEVVTVAQGSNAGYLLDLQEACAERGMLFRTLVTMLPSAVGRYQIADVGAGRYMVSLEPIRRDPLPMAIKRVADVVGALLGLAACGVAYLWYARRLSRESPGRVIFKQERVGRRGRVFTIYKFRTMSLDAEQGLPPLLARNEVRGAMFKIKDDPRILDCGRFLRRTHLDELPQFWNVLKGDMSIVGTRPPLMREVIQYTDHQHRRLSMKPGITGLFQISGHPSITSFDDVVKLDCEYIDHWSLWLDLKVLWLTVVKIIRADGL